jgi:DNA-binding NtrC family response regulator
MDERMPYQPYGHPTVCSVVNGMPERRVPVTSGGEPKKVLVIDDDRILADTLAEILRLHGFLPIALYSGEEAVEFVERFQPDIVLSDIRLHRVDGIEAAKRIRELHPECRVILFTASALARATEQAISDLKFELLSRPLHPDAVIRTLRK